MNTSRNVDGIRTPAAPDTSALGEPADAPPTDPDSHPGPEPSPWLIPVLPPVESLPSPRKRAGTPRLRVTAAIGAVLLVLCGVLFWGTGGSGGVITMTTAILVVAVFVTSAVSAVAGMGGGVGLLAVMATVQPAPVVLPLYAVTQAVSNIARTFLDLRKVYWPIFLFFAPPALLGVFVGVQFYDGDGMTWLQPAIGMYLLVYLAWHRVTIRTLEIPLPGFMPVGLVSGAVSVTLGAAGLLMAPFFLRKDFDPTQVVVTKSACQLSLHLTTVPAFLSAGFAYGDHAQLLVALTVASVAGTYFGRSVLSRMSPKMFTIGFEIMLALLAVRLIVEAF
jgi:uncharacterized protein